VSFETVRVPIVAVFEMCKGLKAVRYLPVEVVKGLVHAGHEYAAAMRVLVECRGSQ
jgi:hypothetical protein